MKLYLAAFAATVIAPLFAATTFAQVTTLISEDFDGNTVGPAFTTTFTDTAGELGDFFRVTDGNDINVAYQGGDGNYFAASDIDGITGITDNMLGGQGAARQQLRFDNFSVVGLTNLSLSFDAAQVGNGWDLPDLMHATIAFDGVTPMDGNTGYALWFDSIPAADTNFNAPAGLDLAYDGDGDAVLKFQLPSPPLQMR